MDNETTNTLTSAYENAHGDRSLEGSSEVAPADNSLAAAYGDRSLQGSGEAARGGDEKPTRSLADVEESLRSEQQGQRKKPKPEPTLSQAYDGETPEAEPGPIADELIPDALKDYSSEDIFAVLTALELNESDLSDPEWVEIIKERLDTELAEAEADESEEEGQEEAEEEQATEEQKTEEVKTETPLPKSLDELTPEQAQQIRTHMDAVYERSQQVNDPLMTDIWVHNLATALQTPPEGMETLKAVAGVLQFGAQNYTEAALARYVPQMMHEYMAENFGGILEAYAPGLGNAFREATVANTWDAVLAEDEFKDLGLPRHGTPAFQEAAERVHKENPWLENFDPPGPDGKPLPVLQALRIKAEVTARLLAGSRVSPAQVMKQVAEGIERGKKDANRNNRRVSASRSLGAGRTKGSFTESKERNALLDAFYERHSNDGGVL